MAAAATCSGGGDKGNGGDGEKGFGLGGGGGGDDDDPWKRKGQGDKGLPVSPPSKKGKKKSGATYEYDRRASESSSPGSDVNNDGESTARGSAQHERDYEQDGADADTTSSPVVANGFVGPASSGQAGGATATQAMNRAARESMSTNPGAYRVAPGRPAERLHSDVTNVSLTRHYTNGTLDSLGSHGSRDGIANNLSHAEAGGEETDAGITITNRSSESSQHRASSDQDDGAANGDSSTSLSTDRQETAVAVPAGDEATSRQEALTNSATTERASGSQRRRSSASMRNLLAMMMRGAAGGDIVVAVATAVDEEAGETDNNDRSADERSPPHQTGSLIVHAKPVRRCGSPRSEGCAVLAAVIAILALALGLSFGLRQMPPQDTNVPPAEFCAEGGGPCWRQVGSDLIASSLGEGFGAMVSMSADGRRVAVSSIYSLGPPENPGSGLVQVYDIDNGGRFTQVGEDLYGMGADGTLPDHSVGRLSGDGLRIIMAKLGSDFAGVIRPGTGGPGWFEPNHGEVSIYEYNVKKTVWEPVGQPLVNEDTSIEGFGFPIDESEDGKTVVVGSRTNGAVRGHVFIQEEGEEGTSAQIVVWNSLGSFGEEIPADDTESSSSSPVYWMRMSSDGSTVALASFLQNSVSIYQHKAQQNSTEWTKIGEIDRRGSGGSFGASVAVSNDNDTISIGIGDPTDGGGGYQSGSARIFEQHPVATIAPESEEWNQVGEDINGMNVLDSQHSVDMTRNSARVASSSFANPDGYARVFDAVDENETGEVEWKQAGGDIIGPSGGGYDFGFSIAISRDDGSRIAVGGPAWGMTQLGLVRLYELI